MLRAICQCKATVYIDPDTGKKFSENSSEYPHKCELPKIPLYEDFNGISCYRSQHYIAADQTRIALQFGLDPYKIRAERRGDYLVLRQ